MLDDLLDLGRVVVVARNHEEECVIDVDRFVLLDGRIHDSAAGGVRALADPLCRADEGNMTDAVLRAEEHLQSTAVAGHPRCAVAFHRDRHVHPISTSIGAKLSALLSTIARGPT